MSGILKRNKASRAWVHFPYHALIISNGKLIDKLTEKARLELWKFVGIIVNGLKDFLSLGRMGVGLNPANPA